MRSNPSPCYLKKSVFDLWLLFSQTVLESIGVSIWQIAAAPCNIPEIHREVKPQDIENGHLTDSESDCQDCSESEDDSNSSEFRVQSSDVNPSLAIACDDGCVRIYNICDAEEFVYKRSLPRVSGENLFPDSFLLCHFFFISLLSGYLYLLCLAATPRKGFKCDVE